ncbi:MAG TPA: aminotransferase class I/II-fold pyridoxal phosphate-dependent enzyme [Streptosporangiaceae bacterium]
MNSHLNTAHVKSAFGVIQGNPREGIVDLGPGYLDPALIPTGLIAKWSADAVERWGPHALAYGANAGPWELRAKFAARVAPAGRTGRCGPERVLITGGTSAALDQLAMRFAREGRIVLTEALTYDLGRMIFADRGVRTIAVPGPFHDLDVAEFRKAAELAAPSSGMPPALYLIPTFHNPTGRVLSATRRLEILAMAADTGSLIIEDLAYSELAYESQPPPPMWSSAADPDQVIALYSLAKCVAPGLRIGWLVGSERLVAELERSPVRASGGGPNHFTAMVVMAGLAGHQFDAHVSLVRDQLRLRRDSLLRALIEQLPGGFTISCPFGGFFAWVGLPAGVSDDALLRNAEGRGVSFAAGSRFGSSPGGVRLCFAGCGPEQLALGVARFADASGSAVHRGLRETPCLRPDLR